MIKEAIKEKQRLEKNIEELYVSINKLQEQVDEGKQREKLLCIQQPVDERGFLNLLESGEIFDLLQIFSYSFFLGLVLTF